MIYDKGLINVDCVLLTSIRISAIVVPGPFDLSTRYGKASCLFDAEDNYEEYSLSRFFLIVSYWYNSFAEKSVVNDGTHK